MSQDQQHATPPTPQRLRRTLAKSFLSVVSRPLVMAHHRKEHKGAIADRECQSGYCRDDAPHLGVLRSLLRASDVSASNLAIHLRGIDDCGDSAGQTAKDGHQDGGHKVIGNYRRRTRSSRWYHHALSRSEIAPAAYADGSVIGVLRSTLRAEQWLLPSKTDVPRVAAQVTLARCARQ